MSYDENYSLGYEMGVYEGIYENIISMFNYVMGEDCKKRKG